MTYKEFLKGLFLINNFSYVQSVSFIKTTHSSIEEGIFEEAIAIKVEAEKIARQIKNKNIIKALLLLAQGYHQWEVGQILGKATETIEGYIKKIKNFLKKIDGK